MAIITKRLNDPSIIEIEDPSGAEIIYAMQPDGSDVRIRIDRIVGPIAPAIAPVLMSGRIETDGYSGVLIWDRTLTVGATAGLTLRVNGVSRAISALSTVGNTIAFALSSPVFESAETVTIEYAPGNISSEASGEPAVAQGPISIENLSTHPDEFDSIEEVFIGEPGSSIRGTSPRTPFDFESPTQQPIWDIPGAGDMRIDLLNQYDMRKPWIWRVKCQDTNQTVALLNMNGPQEFDYHFRVFGGDTGAIGCVVCGAHSGEYIEARWQVISGIGRVRCYTRQPDVNDGVGVQVMGVGVENAVVNRVHYIRLRRIGNNVDVFVNNVPAGTIDATGFEGRRMGFRGNSVGTTGLEQISGGAYIELPEYYYDPSFDGERTGSAGSITNPYSLLSETKTAAQAGPCRIYFKAVDPKAQVLNQWNVLYNNPVDVEASSYGGTDTPHERFWFKGFDFYSEGATGWTAAANGEYWRTYLRTHSLPCQWIESPTVVRGETVEKVWVHLGGMRQSMIAAKLWDQPNYTAALPQIGSLAEGQWAYDEATDRIYIKPYGGMQSDTLIGLSSTDTAGLTIQNGTRVRSRSIGFAGVHGGPAGRAGYRQHNGGSRVYLEHAEMQACSRAGALGNTTGGVQVKSYDIETYQIWVRGTSWKGCATEGPNQTSGVIGLRQTAMYSQDLSLWPWEIFDAENLMATPSSSEIQHRYIKADNIGSIEALPSLTATDGRPHPTGSVADSPSSYSIGYAMFSRVRSALSVSSSEIQDCEDYEAYNIVAVNCTDQNIANKASHRSFIHMRSAADRDLTQTQRHLGTADGPIVVEHCSIVGCDFSEGEPNGRGIFSAHTRDQVPKDGEDWRRYGGDIYAAVRYNLVTDTAGWIFDQYSNSPVGTVDLRSDHNVFHHADKGGEHRVAGATDLVWETAADLIGRSDAVRDQTARVNDANSTTADPVLDANFVPAAGGSADGRAAGSTRPYDLWMKPRTNLVAGAIEVLDDPGDMGDPPGEGG